MSDLFLDGLPTLPGNQLGPCRGQYDEDGEYGEDDVDQDRHGDGGDGQDDVDQDRHGADGDGGADHDVGAGVRRG